MAKLVFCTVESGYGSILLICQWPAILKPQRPAILKPRCLLWPAIPKPPGVIGLAPCSPGSLEACRRPPFPDLSKGGRTVGMLPFMIGRRGVALLTGSVAPKWCQKLAGPWRASSSVVVRPRPPSSVLVRPRPSWPALARPRISWSVVTCNTRFSSVRISHRLW